MPTAKAYLVGFFWGGSCGGEGSGFCWLAFCLFFWGKEEKKKSIDMAVVKKILRP